MTWMYLGDINMKNEKKKIMKMLNKTMMFFMKKKEDSFSLLVYIFSFDANPNVKSFIF